MTMNTLPNFCRVCLKYDKNLIDLAHIENEPSETLMSKLQLCVSEVEWTLFKPLLCHPCIKRLNIAYSFKKQCVQSAGVLKNYVELVKESQKKNESPGTVKGENIIPTAGGAYMLLPNQKYVKILVGSQNQGSNTFQNVFLNLIPATTINSVPQSSDASNTTKNKDTNQNVFLNLNNTFQKFIPLAQPIDPPKKPDVPQPLNVNVNQLLTESKSEELSVEIDPTVFGLEGDDDSNEEEENNDYDEVISQAKITLKDFKSNGEHLQNGKEDQKYYVPILPKQQQEDFVTSGQHFLFSASENVTGPFNCESCQKTFQSKKLLKNHFKNFHLGKLPFKCEYCFIEFLTRSDYELCMKTHRVYADALEKSLTLRDFANTSDNSHNLNISNVSQSDIEANILMSENGEYICDVCHRSFNSSTGLLRHKVRKHNQKNKKKYFIKGMKNAKCDICNREFSTQSYMQLHRKLHLRDDIGYKYKVFGKSKYGDAETVPKEETGGKSVKQKSGQNGMSVKKEDDSSSDDAGKQETSQDPFELENPTSVELKMEVDLENSEHEEEESINPETEENSNQNSSQGENHDTDEQMSEEN